MSLASRLFNRTLVLTVFAVAVFVMGCHKKPLAPPPPPPPAPAPARPTVTLQANPTTINKGESATLSWSSTNATQLTISPDVGAVSPEGSTKVTPSGSTTYTVNATGPGGSADATASVTVSAPPPPPPPAPKGPSIEELFARDVKDAFFDFNKSDIRPDARDALGQTAQFLRDHPEVKVTVEGHCDERGSTEYNLGLGDRRASATKQYLASLGIGADRMNTVSYGKEKPFCMEHEERCWQQNRRGHFVMAK